MGWHRLISLLLVYKNTSLLMLNPLLLINNRHLTLLIYWSLVAHFDKSFIRSFVSSRERSPSSFRDRSPSDDSLTSDVENYDTFFIDDTLNISIHNLPIIDRNRERTEEKDNISRYDDSRENDNQGHGTTSLCCITRGFHRNKAIGDGQQ